MLSATVMGGRQPISNSSILLSEVGAFGRGTSNGLASTTTNNRGSFNITSFTCQGQNSQLFITASGGDAGNGYNSNIFLMAMLGPCNDLPNNVVINEYSTVAAAYAFNLGMSASNPQQIGTDGVPGTPQYIGMTNAGNLLRTNLVNIASGRPAQFLSTGSNSPATLNTLADILVACVNAPAFQFQPCQDLYAAATPPGGSRPSNTLQAIFAIASNPGNNVAGIYDILSEIGSDVLLPYKPTLEAAPNDWTVALNYNPGDLSDPRGMAIDLEGNLWIANFTGGASQTGSVTKLSPIGAEISPAGGFTPADINSPVGLAINAASTAIWGTDFGANTIQEVSQSGALVAESHGNSTFDDPTGIALDSFSQVWVANSGANNPNKQLTVSTTADAVFAFWVNGFGLNVPNNLIIDSTVSPNLVWVANSGSGGASQIVNDGTTNLTGSVVPGGGQQDQRGITLDKNGDVWVTNANGSVTKITGSSATVALGPIAVGGITSTSDPWGIAADSNNTVWVNNFNTNSVTQLDTNGNALSPAGGFTAGGLINGPREGVAIDRSGNVWIVNHGNNTVTELVGASFGPVATPITSGRALLP